MAGQQKTIRVKEEQFLHLRKDIPEFIILTDNKGIIQFINNSNNINNIIGNNIYSLTGKENRQVLEKAIKSCFNENGKSSFEIEMSNNNSSSIWFSIKTEPLILDNKIVAALINGKNITESKIGIDITDHKAMEKALADAEQEKALILGSVSELVTYLDHDLKIIWANRAAYESVANFQGKLEGNYCYKIWHNRNTSCEKCPVLKTLKTQIPQEGEMRTPDGRVWLVKGYPLRSKQSINMGVVEVTSEITQLKKTEKKLRLTQFAIDQAAIATFWTDCSGNFVYVNEKACTSLGYSREELLRMNVINIDPHHTKLTWEVHWKEIQNKCSFTLETEHKRKDGTIFPVEMLINYLYFEGKEYNFAFARDISEKKKSVEEKTKLEEQLLQARKMEALGRLAGGVAHDFNNILTGMQGYIHFIKISLGNDNPLQNDVDEIKHAIERAAGLTEQLLAFSKKQIVAPQILNINTLVDDAHNMLSRIIGEDIELIICKKIKTGQIRFDVHQMDQVLVNLAVNARDAMPKGGKLFIETSSVTIKEKTPAFHTEILPGDYILLRVSDTGYGIDGTIKDRIFEPFFTARKKGKGAGLGLSTVYGIVNQHKGYINVLSRDTGGTVFEIYLPEVIGEIKQEEEIEQFIHLCRGTETILLVEDEEMVRTFTKRFLSLQGYNVLEVSRPDEAGQLCITYDGEIDLLLTDVIMPEMNGKELYEKLKDVIIGLKVLYMSGYSGDVLAHHGILDDNINFIYKPFSIEALTEKIRIILDG